jgi:hypothetical protein
VKRKTWQNPEPHHPDKPPEPVPVHCGGNEPSPSSCRPVAIAFFLF